jgi:hypothetical protein
VKTDPRKACANDEERVWWAFVHDLIAHPLMALFGWNGWTLRFHDWTSRRAWPRSVVKPGAWIEVQALCYDIEVRETSVPGLYQAKCPFMDHVYGMKAVNHQDAAEQAERWFLDLDPIWNGEL